MARTAHVLAATAALACSAATMADFFGFESELTTLGSGHLAWNIYARFTNPGDRVLNVYATDIFTNHAGGFFQSAANPFWQAGNTQNKNTSDDSWVNIGTNPNASGNAGGNGGVTVGDPNFVNFTDANDSTDFSVIQGTGNGAGWYNGNPGNTYGYAFDSNRVLLAHFVWAGEPMIGDKIHWDVRLTTSIVGMGNVEIVAPPVDFFYIPAPGGAGLIALTILTARRRRR